MSHELTTDVDVSQQQGGQLIEVATSRQAQEVQAMSVLAKKYPRDEDAAIRRITTACKRKKLAEMSMYQYARGGTSITGPSIRLAECLAQSWGNIDYGIIELSQANGESQVMAYCWDAETNTRSSKVFTAKHLRSTKQGTYALTDPRDIYEMVANQGARRVRACILAVIPADIQELAIEACTKTLTEGNTEPLVDRIRKMFAAFLEHHGVTKEMIEKRAQRTSESFTEQNLLDLRKVFVSLKDGMSKPEDWFEFKEPTTSEAKPAGESKTAKAAAEMKAKKEAKKAPPAPPIEQASERQVPIELADYYTALQDCHDEAAIRACWSEWILKHKETLAPELYSQGCELRDFMLGLVKPQKQEQSNVG